MRHWMDPKDVKTLLRLSAAIADLRDNPPAAAELLLNKLRDITGAATAAIGTLEGDGPFRPLHQTAPRAAQDCAGHLAGVARVAKKNLSPIAHPTTRLARDNGRGATLCSLMSLGNGTASAVCLQQPRNTRREWTYREIALLDLLHPEITWLQTAPAGKHAGLSPRQRQTLRLLLRGRSEKQIAAELQLSVHTVHVYVKAIYKTYHTSSRAELLAKWVKH